MIMAAVVGGLSSCSSGTDSLAESPLTASDVQASPTPTYLDQVDPDGLIDGKNLTQLTGELVYACLVDRGWAQVQLSDDGGVSANIPEDQSDAYNEDQDACNAEAGARYPFPQVTEKSLRERYALEVENRECLMGEGYTISEPPSVDVWIDQINGSSADVWLPYYEVLTSSDVNTGNLAALYEKCPDPAQRIYLP